MGAESNEERQAEQAKRDKERMEQTWKTHDETLGLKTVRTGGCFPSGTKVSTPLGSLPIDSIQLGDRIVSWDAVNDRYAHSEVLRILIHTENIITTLVFEDGSQLRTTDAHSLSTESGWRRVGLIKPGERVRKREGARTVASVEYGAPEIVYNLITENHFTFIAEDVIVHNFTWFRTLKMKYWTLRQAALGWRGKASPENVRTALAED